MENKKISDFEAGCSNSNLIRCDYLRRDFNNQYTPLSNYDFASYQQNDTDGFLKPSVENNYDKGKNSDEYYDGIEDTNKENYEDSENDDNEYYKNSENVHYENYDDFEGEDDVYNSEKEVTENKDIDSENNFVPEKDVDKYDIYTFCEEPELRNK